jgi:hypothetical protein
MQPRHFSNLLPGIHSAPAARVAAANALLDRGYGKQAAAEELLKRRSTRRSLAAWARHKGFEPAKHHLLRAIGESRW